jgi:hypothetical protein
VNTDSSAVLQAFSRSASQTNRCRIASVYTWSERNVTDVRAELDDLADRHRGESVVVVVDDAQHAAISDWAAGPGGRDDADGPLVLEGDADGWRIR